METIEHFEISLGLLAEWIGVILEAIAVFCVLLGLVLTARKLLRSARRREAEFLYLETRLRFGMWLALALEFQLGADILATAVSPTFTELGKLGAIAAIRTFLNYFLNKELEAEAEARDRKAAESRESANLPT